MKNKNLRRLPKVEIPNDLTPDELKSFNRSEVVAVANKLRRGMIDENR